MIDFISILEARRIFNTHFCKEKGWDLDNLSIEQVLEIRKQEGWKNPKINESKEAL